MRIVLVRHGESQGNVDPLAYGRIGDPDITLTPAGWQQAFRLGDFLARFYKNNPINGYEYPQVVDTSTWIRAVQTEEAGTRHFHDTTNIIFRRDEGLREQSFGLLYRTHTTCDHALTKLLNDAADAYKNNPFEALTPEGDSAKTHYERVWPVAQRILQEAVHQNIRDRLVFAHGLTNRHLVMIFKGLPPQTGKTIENPRNCDAWLLENKSNGFTIRKIYDGISGLAVDEEIVIAPLKPHVPAP